MNTTPATSALTAAVKKTLTSAAFGKFMQQAVQTAVDELQSNPYTLALQRPPISTLTFTEGDDFRCFDGRSADKTREIHMQCRRTSDGHKPGIWYGSESLIDVNGTIWSRSLGDHVQDDFGMLVRVAA